MAFPVDKMPGLSLERELNKALRCRGWGGSPSLSKDARVQSYVGLSADRRLSYIEVAHCDAAANARSGLPAADPTLWSPPHRRDQMDGSGILTQEGCSITASCVFVIGRPAGQL